jgi:flap endonuclease-1
LNSSLFCIGDEEAVDKFVRRTVKVTREHNEDCKRLLRLMGVPFVDAPTEAEARKIYFSFSMIILSLFYLECAALVKQGKVYGVGTEDMDVREIVVFSVLNDLFRL